MLQQSTLVFLKNLKKNNHKEWFDNNRPAYERARGDFEQLTASILKLLSKTDDSVAHLEPRQCMFRINRDIRFSKDKTPYKTNFSMYASKGGKKTNFAGYYFHLEPGGSFAAGGLWMPLPADLRKVRQEIDYNEAEFISIVESRKFTHMFGGLEAGENVLTRPPKGYDTTNPAIRYLKYKSFNAIGRIADADLLTARLARKIVDRFAVLRPLVGFCNRALEE